MPPTIANAPSTGFVRWKNPYAVTPYPSLRVLCRQILETRNATGQQTIRWAVGSQDGLRSATWMLKGNKKGDAYLTVRHLGGILKASFHKDSRCHLGFVAEYALTAKEKFGFEHRHWDRWVLPESAVVRVAQVVVGWGELYVSDATEKSETIWLPRPQPGFAAVVSVFVAQPGSRLALQRATRGGTLIGLLEYPTRTIAAVHSSSPLSANITRTACSLLGSSPQLSAALSAPLRPDDLRAFYWGSSTGSPVDLFFLETALPSHANAIPAI